MGCWPRVTILHCGGCPLAPAYAVKARVSHQVELPACVSVCIPRRLVPHESEAFRRSRVSFMSQFDARREFPRPPVPAVRAASHGSRWGDTQHTAHRWASGRWPDSRSRIRTPVERHSGLRREPGGGF